MVSDQRAVPARETPAAVSRRLFTNHQPLTTNHYLAVIARRVIDFAAYLAVRLLICVVQAVPIETGARLARPLARIVCERLRLRQEVVDTNLRHAFPQLSPAARHELALRSWEHLFLMVVEIAHAVRKIHETNWRRYVMLRNVRAMVRAQLSDRPTICLAGHFGNFEVCGYVTGMLGIPSFTVARPLDNPFLDRFVNRFRAAQGQQVLEKLGSSQEIERQLAQGANFVVLADQAAGRKGCWVEFFGRPASTHKAIALFSLTNDAPMFVTYFLRTGRPMRFELGCQGQVDPRDDLRETAGVRELTQWFTTRIEDSVRRGPEQYWWVHRRWKDARVRSKRRRQAA